MTKGGLDSIVIVGASLAGLRTAEALRDEGFDGQLTLIGEENHEPYDRPPLSKQVLSGKVEAGQTTLPALRAIDAEWRLGRIACGLDIAQRRVHLTDGSFCSFDRLVIATGASARRWAAPAEAALEGVTVLRTRDDAERLRAMLRRGPSRVLVVGGGFTGGEVASSCRELGLPVTLIEAAPFPLGQALGRPIGRFAADLYRAHGVDLRCGRMVTALEGDRVRRLTHAQLDDGSRIAADVAVVCLGAVPNIEWLENAGLMTGAWGLWCDAYGRALDRAGRPLDEIYAAGDVACMANPHFPGERLRSEHWGSACSQARMVGHNAVHGPADLRIDRSLSSFWSFQFGMSFKSVGAPHLADALLVVQGSLQDGRFVALYGRRGSVVAALSINQSHWLPFYAEQIESGAAFPPHYNLVDPAPEAQPEPLDFSRDARHSPRRASPLRPAEPTTAMAAATGDL